MLTVEKTLIEALIQRLERLVAAPTLTSEPRVSAATVKLVAREFKRAGMQVATGTNHEFPYLYAHFQPLEDTKFWLYAHLDVVGAPPDQFQLRRRDGRLYGRGAFDMKFAIAVYQQLCTDLGSSAPPIGIIITSDEEHSGIFGAGYLAPQLSLVGKSVVIPDGGGVWAIEQAAKGVLWASIDVQGVPAHAARIEQGTNAIEKAFATAQEVKTELQAGEGSAFGDTTVNLGRISGGQAINQVPHRAHIDLDIRFVPPITLEALTKKLAAVAKRTGTSITPGPYTLAVQHNTNNPDTQRLRAIMADHVGKSVPFVNSYGASDAQFFAAVGANPIVFYPEGGGQHTTEEYITERGLQQCYEILHEFITGIE